MKPIHVTTGRDQKVLYNVPRKSSILAFSFDQEFQKLHACMKPQILPGLRDVSPAQLSFLR